MNEREKIVEMLLQVESNGQLNFDATFDDDQPVKNLSFGYQGEQFPVDSVFSNDIYNVDAEEEYIDFHFKFRHQGYDLEFIYDNWEDVYFLQSESKEALKLFDASANFFEIENSKIKWLYPKE